MECHSRWSHHQSWDSKSWLCHEVETWLKTVALKGISKHIPNGDKEIGQAQDKR